MHPVICTIGPFTIYSYGLMLAIAFVAGSALAAAEAKRQGVSSDTVFNLSLLALICGVIGARILYVAENMSHYLKEPLEIIMLNKGGLSWFGGLISGCACAIAYLKKKKMPVYRMLDLVSPFIALAQAIGRIGCLLNGCCFGVASKFGIYFQVHDKVLVPTQIYSSLALVFIFIALRFLQERPHKEGQIFFAYLIFYSTKRFIIEFWRQDNEILVFGLTLFQLIALGIFCLSAWKLLVIRKRKN